MATTWLIKDIDFDFLEAWNAAGEPDQAVIDAFLKRTGKKIKPQSAPEQPRHYYLLEDQPLVKLTVIGEPLQAWQGQAGIVIVGTGENIGEFPALKDQIGAKMLLLRLQPAKTFSGKPTKTFANGIEALSEISQFETLKPSASTKLDVLEPPAVAPQEPKTPTISEQAEPSPTVQSTLQKRSSVDLVQTSLRGDEAGVKRLIERLKNLEDITLRNIELRPGSRPDEYYCSFWIAAKYEVAITNVVQLPSADEAENPSSGEGEKDIFRGGGRKRATESTRQKSGKLIKDLDPDDEKICSVCGETKKLKEFSHKTHKQGYTTYTADCLVCRRAKARQWYAKPEKKVKHIEKVIEKKRTKKVAASNN